MNDYICLNNPGVNKVPLLIKHIKNKELHS